MQQGLRLRLQPLFGIGCLNRDPVQQLPHVLRARTASCSRSIHQRFAAGGRRVALRVHILSVEVGAHGAEVLLLLRVLEVEKGEEEGLVVEAVGAKVL